MTSVERLRRRRDRRIRQLERSGTLKHWTSSARRQRWLYRASRRITTARDRLDEKRDDVGLLPDLIRRALLTGIGACLLLVVVELVASALSHHGVHLTRRLDKKLDPSAYEGLVVAVVGAEVFFLALFYTTVGVIASTAYQSVPGEIRQLFVQERGSRFFTRSVVRTLVLGVLVLSLAAVNYKPYALTIVVLALLAVFSVLSLVVLGTGLFNFFDLSSLSTPLPRRFARALKAASASERCVPDEARQRLAHYRAAQVLRLYRQLSTLLRARSTNETAAPRRVLYQLLAIGDMYGALKPAIPMASLWYARVPAHHNWLTLDHTRLGIALETRTGIQPELVPDRLWVERELAARLHDLLPLLLNEADWPTAIELTDAMNRLIAVLASRLEIDEALLFHMALRQCLHESITTSTPPSQGTVEVQHAAETWRTFRLAAAERSILSVTALWLGFVEAARVLSLDRLQVVWDRGVRDESAPYRVGAPRELLTVLEEIASGIALEERSEGRRVTPSWWVHHYSARALSRHLIAGARLVLNEVNQSVVPSIERIAIDVDADLAAVMTFEALELASKLETHLPVVQAALDQLSAARNEHAGDDQWPDDVLDGEVVVEIERRLLRHLSKVSVALTPDPHDASRPDLFGQAYKVLFDATFRAILGGVDALARDLFPVVLFGADRARARLVDDLANERLQERFIFGTEPLIDLMELSGYALLMQELNGTGIWDDVRKLWDALSVNGAAPALAEQMSGILKARESIFALTQGGLERTTRKMQLDRLLRGRGIVESHYWSPFTADQPPPHSSAIVCAFAPDDLGGFEELADLFLVEYLLTKPGSESMELSHTAESLKSQIHRKRERAEGAQSADGAELPTPESDAEQDDPPVDPGAEP